MSLFLSASLRGQGMCLYSHIQCCNYPIMPVQNCTQKHEKAAISHSCNFISFQASALTIWWTCLLNFSYTNTCKYVNHYHFISFFTVTLPLFLFFFNLQLIEWRIMVTIQGTCLWLEWDSSDSPFYNNIYNHS